MSPIVTLPTVVTGYDVEQAVIDTLKFRLPNYMAQEEITSPRSYIRISSGPIEKFPENQIPSIMVQCGGLYDEPDRLGDGTYIAQWGVGVFALVSGKNEEQVARAAKIYGAYIRAILVQQGSLTPTGFARGVRWMDETYDELTVPQRRTLATAELMFVVEVGNVVNARELPMLVDVPEAPDPTPGPAVTSVEVIVNPVETDQEVNP